MNFNETTHSMSGIYRIVFENQKSYIGLTNDLRRRMIEHMGKDIREHPELPINKAIQKYTIQNIELLEEIEPEDRQKLIQQEKYWIAYYETFNNPNKGYNITPGGDGAASGIYNVSASLNQQQLDLVVNLLLNSNLTYEEIIDKLGISITRAVIRGVNNGNHYKDSSLTYPLRQERVKKIGIDNKTSKFYQNEDLLNNIINALKDPTISYDEIIQLYDVSASTLTLINNGKKYYQENLQYPIRPKNANQKRYFSKEEMDYIKNSLETGKTMESIASCLKCDRKVISDINKGKRQPQLNWKYPLKK